jgi:hypothetical protein
VFARSCKRNNKQPCCLFGLENGSGSKQTLNYVAKFCWQCVIWIKIAGTLPGTSDMIILIAETYASMIEYDKFSTLAQLFSSKINIFAITNTQIITFRHFEKIKDLFGYDVFGDFC